MAVTKLDLEEPTTVNLSSHRMGSVIPVVEISDQDNGCSGGRSAIEVDGLGGASPAVAIEASGTRYHIHTVMVVRKGVLVFRVRARPQVRIVWRRRYDLGEPVVGVPPGARIAARCKRKRIAPELLA